MTQALQHIPDDVAGKSRAEKAGVGRKVWRSLGGYVAGKLSKNRMVGNTNANPDYDPEVALRWGVLWAGFDATSDYVRGKGPKLDQFKLKHPTFSKTTPQANRYAALARAAGKLPEQAVQQVVVRSRRR